MKEELTNERKKIAKRSIGEPGQCQGKEKVLLVIGATGSGKSTLINGMANYIMGVKWEDDFRFQLVIDDPKVSKSRSQTQYITAYTFHPMEGSAVSYKLTVIDTPGFGDSEGLKSDKDIAKQIKEFFSIPSPNGIQQLDGIAFVTRANLTRLTPHQEYIFNSVLSMFGKDLGKNIFLMVTFADREKPPILQALNDANLTVSDRHFKFNNSALFADNKNEDEVSFDALFWKMNFPAFGQFFTLLSSSKNDGIELTKEVLSERDKLHTLLEHIVEDVANGARRVQNMREDERWQTAKNCHVRLNEIALKSNPVFNVDHLQLLINSEKQQAEIELKLSDGTPSIYKLQMKEELTNERKKIAKRSIGEPGQCQGKEKVLLVIGATGSGKSTLINGMANYIMGVKWEDDFRFQLVIDDPKVSKSRSQTQYITAYTFHPMEGSAVSYKLTVIDTPGFGDSEGLKSDKDIAKQIKEFFSIPSPNGIQQLDGIAFVTRANLTRLTPHQEYIFNSVLSIFRTIFTQLSSFKSDGIELTKQVLTERDKLHTLLEHMVQDVANGAKRVQNMGEDESWQTAKNCHVRLNEIALKSNPVFNVDHLQLLIKSEKQQAEIGHLQRVKYLDEAKRQAEMLFKKHRLAEAARLEELKLSDGTPSIYKLQMKEELTNERKKIAKRSIGEPGQCQGKEKVLLVIGATGSGKSTLINGMANYIMGVKWEDDFRFQLVIDDPKVSKSRSQTQYITAYTFHPMEGSAVSYKLTVIDTPGFGDSEGLKSDKDIAKQIKEFFFNPFTKRERDKLHTLLEHIVEDVANGARRVQNMREDERWQTAKNCHVRLNEIALKSNPVFNVDHLQLLINSEKQQAEIGHLQRVKYLEEAKRQAEMLFKKHRLAEAARLEELKLSDGTPSIYKLQMKEELTNERKKIAKRSIGEPGQCQGKEKVLLVIGATGSGKSTLINGMANYIMGVKWEDDFHIAKQIKEFFSIPSPNGIQQLDGIAFVTRANLTRLTPHQEYIFNSVLSMFGKDLGKNIFLMVTFADHEKPPILQALNDANLTVSDRHFKFNNSALFADNKNEDEVSFDALFWKMNFRAFG
ncbi:unnamed protein product [Porites lobata]|uniref:AAA+ ATPase domain-containing protein n=1 Tax=Porites lobata TaxID=104759 RepID=A0ABN8MYS6_9CNID|nr:unnamed protein product [Porites lobata]